jgi:ribosomal protein L9
MGYDVDKKKIKMDPVKTVGSCVAEIRLMENVSAKITVVISGL